MMRAARGYALMKPPQFWNPEDTPQNPRSALEFDFPNESDEYESVHGRDPPSPYVISTSSVIKDIPKRQRSLSASKLKSKLQRPKVHRTTSAPTPATTTTSESNEGPNLLQKCAKAVSGTLKSMPGPIQSLFHRRTKSELDDPDGDLAKLMRRRDSLLTTDCPKPTLGSCAAEAMRWSQPLGFSPFSPLAMEGQQSCFTGGVQHSFQAKDRLVRPTPRPWANDGSPESVKLRANEAKNEGWQLDDHPYDYNAVW